MKQLQCWSVPQCSQDTNFFLTKITAIEIKICTSLIYKGEEETDVMVKVDSHLFVKIWFLCYGKSWMNNWGKVAAGRWYWQEGTGRGLINFGWEFYKLSKDTSIEKTTMNRYIQTSVLSKNYLILYSVQKLILRFASRKYI